MNPIISDKKISDDNLSFRINNIHVSFVNGLRRIILSEIPTVVFKTFPEKENDCKIIKNTSGFNNEIIKQRLSCIPVHISNISVPVNNLVLKVKYKNDSSNIEYVTTEKFKIFDEGTNKFLPEKMNLEIFPKNKITNNYIDFVKLLPAFMKNSANTSNGEEIELECRMSIDCAKTNSMFNVVSKASFGNTQISRTELDKLYEIYRETQQKKESYNEEELSIMRDDWFALNAKRHYINDCFEFTITSLGIFSNIEILLKASTILKQKIQTMIDTPTSESKSSYVLSKNETFSENCYDIILKNEDYTVGKIMEYILYTSYITSGELLFVSFIKKHPHDIDSIIRIVFKKEVIYSTVIEKLNTQFNLIMKILDKLEEQIKTLG